MVELVQIQPKSFISRSAILTFKACEYKGYLTYFFSGHGVTPTQASLELTIGTVCHRGIQHLLEHCRVHHPDGKFDDQCIDEAVEKAKEVWLEVLNICELALHSNEYERISEILPEQECLFEGLIRAWAIRKLPGILEEYEILEVEHEEVFENFSDIVTFLGKADGLFLRKSDKKLIILSIKTASQYLEVTERDILHDMQGVSEWVCVKDRLDNYWNNWITTNEISNINKCLLPTWARDFFTTYQIKPEIFAVQYEFLVKGQRKQDPWGSGIYKQQSFLCHPYKQESLMTLSGGSFNLSPSDYKWVHKEKGRLPKGWDKIDIWADMGIKNWIDFLATGKVQPEEGDPFESILITPPLVLRQPEELEEWLVSTRFYAERLHAGLERIRAEENRLQIAIKHNEEELIPIFRQQLQKAIWEEFPKDTRSCHNFYGKDCQFVKHCHELIDLTTGISAGMYKIRTPHHELEMEKFIKEGYLDND